MTPNAIIDQPGNPGLLNGGRAAAIGLALMVIAYGIVRPPDYLVASEAATSAEAQNPSSAAPGPVSVTPTASVARDATPESQGGTIDAPRECAVDKGITEACVFD